MSGDGALYDFEIDFSDMLSLTDSSCLGAIDSGVQDAVETEMTAAVIRARGTTEFLDNTHNLRDSITHDQTGTFINNNLEVGLFSPIGYSGFIEYGTQPHLIVPKVAKVLVWQGMDGLNVAHKVNHPGIRARHFLAAAFDDEALKTAVADSIVKALQENGK